jgi:hypothetical protein
VDFFGKLVKVAILVAFLATVVNDSGWFLTSQYDLSNVTRDAAAVSADAIKANGGDRTAAWRAGETIAEKSGVSVYGYDVVNNESVHLWTRVKVPNTWVMRPVAALLSHKPLSTPLEIEDEAVAAIR